MTVSVEIAAGIAIVTVDNPPVNALSHAVRLGLVEAVAQTEADDSVRAVVLRCGGRTFIAGADVKEFGKPPVAPELPDVIRRIERATRPWIAAIHGAALGGGLEIALACHYRVADAKAKLGMPEVNLGLIPGAGGTVRLPRLVAADAALDLIAGGRPVSAQKARGIGLVDLVAEGDLVTAARQFAEGQGSDPLPVPLIDRAPIPPADAAAFEAQKAKIRARARGQIAPGEAIAAVERALTDPADAAAQAEREAFLRLRRQPQSLALRHIFFAEREVSRLPATKGIAPRPLGTVGVIGGGTMGAGIAAACLLAKLRVVMIERDDAALDAGQARVAAILDDSHKRGILNDAARAAAGAAFSGATDYSALAGADLVVEAVFEDMDVKKEVFARLDAVVRPDAVLASNTSYLDLDELAATTRDPSRVIGLHFFSPAHVMKLLELVVTRAASPEVLATGLDLGKRLGKITVPAGVCDGFIGNRVMSAYRRECDYMVEDGALPEQVDAAMVAFGFPMGIYAMQDMAGLDISWAMRKRQAATRPADQRYVAIADRLCEAGRLGRKTGQGWFDYSADKRGAPDAQVVAIIEDESRRQGIERRAFSEDQIIERILTVMQEEGRRILDEGIAGTPDAIDVVMVNGYGFPRWKGGPMYLANQA